MRRLLLRLACVAAVCAAFQAASAAQQTAAPQPIDSAGAAKLANPPAPRGYVIGPEDLLTVIFWRDKEFSGDVVVRPDGKISLPLLNDVQAAGLTPEQLKLVVEEAAAKYIEEPNATVIVREIRSRKVYVVGEVANPGTVVLMSDMNVLQLIAAVGGLLEHADRKNVTIVRQVNGREQRFKFNYNDVTKGKKLQQNIQLQPGDMVVVR
jgi:polysaccharide biosynthesis/export protein